MINCKERLGYTKVMTNNPEEQKVLLAYCEGKSFLWNMFLGWRETRNDTMFFWIPSKKVEILIATTKF